MQAGTIADQPREDRNSLKNTPPAHVVVATLSCALDMLERNTLRGDYFRLVVIDDGDRLLEQSGPMQILEIFNALPGAT